MASRPSISGIWTSISTRSYGIVSSALTASAPLATASARSPSFFRMPRATCWLVMLSSASRMRTAPRRISRTAWRVTMCRAVVAHRRTGQHGGQAVEELRLPHRLGQVGGKPDLLHLPRVAPLAQGGHQHQAGVLQRLVGLDGPGQVRSVHARHLHVEDGRREGIARVPGPRQRLQRRRGRPRPLPPARPRPGAGPSGPRGWWRCRPPPGRAPRESRRPRLACVPARPAWRGAP